MSLENEKLTVNDFEIDVDKQTILMKPSGWIYNYTWLADGGIVAIKWYDSDLYQAEDVRFVGPNTPLVTKINAYVFEREVLNEQNKQRQKEEAE